MPRRSVDPVDRQKSRNPDVGVRPNIAGFCEIVQAAQTAPRAKCRVNHRKPRDPG